MRGEKRKSDKSNVGIYTYIFTNDGREKETEREYIQYIYVKKERAGGKTGRRNAEGEGGTVTGRG
jgi:predicted lipoprotein with Yx(FWY)xxD motif